MAYRRHFGAGKQWHRLKTEGASAYLMSRGRTARRLEWWGAGIADIGGCKYLQEEDARELWRKIEHLARRHDAAELAQVHHQSALVQLAQDSNWRVEAAETCPVLELPDSFDDYVRGLRKNMREQIKRYPKRLAKEFSSKSSWRKAKAKSKPRWMICFNCTARVGARADKPGFWQRRAARNFTAKCAANSGAAIGCACGL